MKVTMFKLKASTIASLCLVAGFAKVEGKLPFDIYGDASRFELKDDVFVDKDTCEYTALLQFNLPAAGLPFPAGPESCTLEDSSCEGQSCLFEMRNVYRFSHDFKKATGFNHVGIDWSPCGHPPLEYFSRPHLNLHAFRISPEEREEMECDMLNPFICAFPTENQSTVSGKKYFVVGKDAASNKVANVVDTHTYELDTAVPGEGIHVYNHTDLIPVAEWFDPLLIMGSYNGNIHFWEPMFPSEFASGSVPTFYDEAPVYNSQTIASLPSYWSMAYDPDTEVTTLTIKGKAEKCIKTKSEKNGKKTK